MEKYPFLKKKFYTFWHSNNSNKSNFFIFSVFGLNQFNDNLGIIIKSYSVIEEIS